jgi:hypothetical protein
MYIFPSTLFRNVLLYAKYILNCMKCARSTAGEGYLEVAIDRGGAAVAQAV